MSLRFRTPISCPRRLAGLTKGDDFALRLAGTAAACSCPTLIDRKDDLSGNPKLKRQTNLPHREFIYRMAYEMGRTLDRLRSAEGARGGGLVRVAKDDKLQDRRHRLRRRRACSRSTPGRWTSGSRLSQRSGYFGPRESTVRGADRPQRVGPARRVRRRRTRRRWSTRGDFDPQHRRRRRRTWDGPVEHKPGRGGAAPGSSADARRRCRRASIDTGASSIRKLNGTLPYPIGGRARRV